MKKSHITKQASQSSESRIDLIRRSYQAMEAKALHSPVNSLITWLLKEAETCSKSGPVSAFVGHAYYPHFVKGAYAIEIPGTSFNSHSKVITAVSDHHVQLIAIVWLLTKWFKRGGVDIYSTDEVLMDQLGGHELWRWRQQGWRGTAGLLKHPELLSVIAETRKNRIVRFIYVPDNEHLKAVQMRANATLLEWRNRRRNA